MKSRWDDDEAEYPPQLLAGPVMAAKRRAVEWIDANAPQHFARAGLS